MDAVATLQSKVEQASYSLCQWKVMINKCLLGVVSSRFSWMLCGSRQRPLVISLHGQGHLHPQMVYLCNSGPTLITSPAVYLISVSHKISVHVFTSQSALRFTWGALAGVNMYIIPWAPVITILRCVSQLFSFHSVESPVWTRTYISNQHPLPRFMYGLSLEYGLVHTTVIANVSRTLHLGISGSCSAHCSSIYDSWSFLPSESGM